MLRKMDTKKGEGEKCREMKLGLGSGKKERSEGWKCKYGRSGSK
jgi:hypothetical protein